MKKIFKHYGKFNITLKEKDIVILLARGHSFNRIGELIGMSGRTIEYKARQMRLCSGTRNNIELVVFALKKQLITMAEIYDELGHVPAASSKLRSIDRPPAAYDNKQWVANE